MWKSANLGLEMEVNVARKSWTKEFITKWLSELLSGSGSDKYLTGYLKESRFVYRKLRDELFRDMHCIDCGTVVTCKGEVTIEWRKKTRCNEQGCTERRSGTDGGTRLFCRHCGESLSLVELEKESKINTDQFVCCKQCSETYDGLERFVDDTVLKVIIMAAIKEEDRLLALMNGVPSSSGPKGTQTRSKISLFEKADRLRRR